jgi:diguanylate cyclase (GGDEF)-like protein
MRVDRQLAGVAVLVAFALAVPEARYALLVVTNWLALALVVSGIRRHRPARWRTWALVTLFVTFIAIGNSALAFTGASSQVVLLATTAGQLSAAAALPGLMSGASLQRNSTGRLLDLAVLAVVTSLGATELALRGLARHAETGGSWTLMLGPVIDAVLVGALLWIVLSRARLGQAMVLNVAGGFGSLAYDVMVTTAGHRVAPPGHWLEALGIANMLLFGLAAVHPSMARLGTRTSRTQQRRSSLQFLLLLPCALTPALLVVYATLGGPLLLPLPVLAAATVFVVLVALLRALTALRETERGAERDALTGLLNRTGLIRAYAGRAQTGPSRGSALRGGSATSRPARWLLMVDLDDFKRVNDRHGHSTGDALLMAVSSRLRGVIGNAGVVARHGGDEFIVLVDAAHERFRTDPGRVVLNVLSSPVEIHGHVLPVGASIGVVPVGWDDDLERLLADADMAMYVAKRSGKSAASVFHPQLREEVLRQLATVEDLRRILTHPPTPSAGELRVFYQPIIDLADGRVVAAEALARWQHPERGLVPPDEFLTLIEREGLGIRLDQAVLHVALEQLGRWDHQGLRLHGLSVNLGLSSMCDPDLPRWVADITASHRIHPDRLRLEITEHDELPEEDRIRAGLAHLVDAGFALSLDDFGVGYSSLSYLQRYPISLLKLDRSLVDHDDPASQPLITAIAGLGRSLGLDLLAEGIETAAQRDALRRVGVRYGQGFFFARPLPALEFAEFCRSRAEVPTQAGARVG